ncbi:MAG: peptide chain release factor N(5)-glutamine methyltransferase, partial [Clostridia bacterium]|nr:peptide chain release factor N(5)-glutamine methyltransferase [Clostridia bacterium]
SYIVGHREFMSLDFKVNSSTLIPRADTEILVEELIKIYEGKKPFIFEIGTGSGCIPVSLAYYIKDAHIMSCDISEKAIETAKENAKNNGVADRVSFIEHDILSGFPALEEAPDCIVSNPPYIESDVTQTLDENVKNFEPLSALDGGRDGLDFYRSIIKENPLRKGGLLAFEIGYNQGKSVSGLMENDYTDIRIIKDLGGNDRVITGIKK